jgi:hypothetical protein
MADKPFQELTRDEAVSLAKTCVAGAKSEDEIRVRLKEVGFDSEAAALASHSDGRNFQASMFVNAPNGPFIRVDSEVVRT